MVAEFTGECQDSEGAWLRGYSVGDFSKKEECLAECFRAGKDLLRIFGRTVTGCEWGASNGWCGYKTKNVVKASGETGYICWKLG